MAGRWVCMSGRSPHCSLGAAGGLWELALRSRIWGAAAGRPGAFSFGSCHALAYLSRPVRAASAGAPATESPYQEVDGGAGGPVHESPAVLSAP